MTSTALIKNIVTRIRKFKLLIVAAGMVLGALLLFYAKQRRPVYTAKATVFPLTTPSDNPLSSSALSGLLGIETAPKSFSSEASINIIELITSRNVREKVAATRLAALGNQSIAALLVNDRNEHRIFFQKEIPLLTDTAAMAVIGAGLLEEIIVGKMSKNGVLVLYFSSARKELVSPVTNALISVLSQFYIDLKISKALADYDFTVKKIDSLEGFLTGVNRRAIALQNSTFFTPVERLQYSIPRENLSMEKGRVIRQRDMAVSNREEATWRLQKATPIISILDKPTEPFLIEKPSAVLYGIGGFIAGCFLLTLLLISGLLVKYTMSEIKKIFLDEEDALPVKL